MDFNTVTTLPKGKKAASLFGVFDPEANVEESPVVVEENFFRSSAIDRVRQNDIRSANKTESKVKTRSQSRVDETDS